MKMVHLIQHTHWDREWYFTENDSQALLYYFMEDLMAKLEADPDLGPFVLDGQTVVVDDYLEIAPENQTRLASLVQQGRILIGPWYSQTDFMVVGAESITRNLLLGINRAQQIGPVMKVGYVPDSFGQTEQLPMFLNQFGIDSAVFWRGWSENEVAHTEFNWRSPSGSEVITAVLPWGYGCAKWLPTDADTAQPRVVKACDGQARFSATDHLLLPNGNDQSPFEHRVPAMLAELNGYQNNYRFKNSSFSQFFADIAASGVELASYSGEFLAPKYMRIHRGIFSTRMDIKLANARLEQRVSQYLEPLLAVNWTLGLPYPAKAVEKIWLEAMKSHPHDSIGGCNSDRVNQMVLGRLASGIEMADQLIELNLRKLCEGIEAQQEGTKILLFNSLPFVRDGVIELTLLTPETDFQVVDSMGNPCRYQVVAEELQDMSTIVQELSNDTEPTWYHKLTLLLEVPKVPSAGYLTLYLQEGVVSDNATVSRVESRVIANDWLELTLQTDGRLSLLDKRNQTSYDNIMQLVDGGDDGDNYNYSPLRDDWLIQAAEHLTEWRIEQGELASTLHLSYQLPVPADLASRTQRQANALMPLTMTVTLPHHAAQLEVEVELDNQICDHRLQLLLPTGLVTDQHYADQPFGLIARDNVPAAMACWQQQGWTEAPAALYPMQSLVAMNDGQRGLAVVTEGLREYEIPQQATDTLAITLIRSVGWLGKADQLYRPGRASGMALPSPDSQLPGQWRFKLCVIPQQGGINQTEFWHQVECWRTPLMSHIGTDWARFRLNPHGMVFPAESSVLNWDTPLCFSSMKRAEDGNGLILRGYNPTRTPLDGGTIQSESPVSHSTLAERIGEPVINQQIGAVTACAPVTLYLDHEGK
ncbi:alpha-mannosidase [Photobacterium sagamiensis]|uniref:glycoside hydrolase family 38 N-terminal domain-containing protein n=1 Tax=Photobacterium sagamiensis TaxID=2910241 RepID=UPI003D147AFB